MTLDILTWFQKAIPTPTDKNRGVQLGCHFEEVDEMLHSIGEFNADTGGDGGETVATLAGIYKGGKQVRFDGVDRKELLDSVCDQIVTAVGVAHMFGFDIMGALEEVNRSNWTKFVNGEPVFDANGKIAKPPTYSPPDLTPFIGK